MGLYFCKIEDEDYLKNYLDELKKTTTSKSTFLKQATPQCYNEIADNVHKEGNKVGARELTLTPVSGKVTSINSKINHFKACGNVRESSNPGTTTTTTSTSAIPNAHTSKIWNMCL